MTTIDRSQFSRVVAVANGKGGVGKSSLTASLGGLAAAAGFRVLLIDFDPQGDLADDLGLRGAAATDDGQALVASLLFGTPLSIVVESARPNLDVITGGEHLASLGGALFAKHAKGKSDPLILARALEPLVGSYDLVLIDTPPVDVTLQTLALAAARWLLIPTKADRSSIRGLATIAERVVDARDVNDTLEVLGVVLFDVPSSATRVRAEAVHDIETALGGVAPVFDTVVRSAAATARESRSRGLLVHELAEQVEGAEPFWKNLRDGVTAVRLPGSAPALAADYIALVDAVLTRIDQLETQEMAE